MGCRDWKKAETILIRKGDKDTYEVVKSWRMIHLLPVMSKVVDRIILSMLAKTVVLEDTQYGSRKNRSTHDAMKQILEFLEYNKDKCTSILSIDVEGGFDKVNIDMLCDILIYRECEPKLVHWIRRWTRGRKIQLRFNGKISKEYHLNQGVPQGSPLSPFLFGVYVADMFKPRFSYRMGLRRMVTSYVDDGAILVATDTIEKTKEEIRSVLEECTRIAKDRGMGFSTKKMEWIGFGKGEWGDMEVGTEKLRMTKEIRILGYRIDTKKGWKGHVEYWTDRGMGVRRNISNVSRRFGSSGGIGAWECVRMIKGAYLPTVCYGLEFITGETELLRRQQITINDTIRSIFRTPPKIANKILYAETGIEPLEIKCRELERKGYARHLKYEYGKDAPWFGSIARKWKDDRLRKPTTISNEQRKTTPTVLISRNKDEGIEAHRNRWGTKDESELWVYTDGSKRKNEAAISWILMEGDELEEEEHGMRVPGEWSITKVEICAIAVALRDMRRIGKGKIRIFSDSRTGIKMIEDMKEEEGNASMWDRMTRVLNEWDSVTLEWIPGHMGIKGNELADKAAKTMRNKLLEKEGRWKMMDYEESEKTKIGEWKEEEWKRWHNDNGHNYYERLPKKPKHLKNLTRLDGYVLMRLRSGSDKRGHEECKNYEFRHHLALCDKYKKKQPELHTLYDDKEIDNWKKWWIENEYLGMGIPTNTESHDDVRIMYGNPFDGTITIERNGTTITENIEKSKCKRCDKHHFGRCIEKKRSLKNGRWFFVNEDDLECKVCNGKFGGGSTNRPGGSGLIKHLQNRKDSCGREWEKEFWLETVDKWEDWDEEYQAGLVQKWMELYKKKLMKCGQCGKEYKVQDGLRIHIRKEKRCMGDMVKMMLKFPLGTDGD